MTPRRCGFFLVRTHYRTALNYSDVHLDDAYGAQAPVYTRWT
jgi:cysteinyl-tRNA synthetase